MRHNPESLGSIATKKIQSEIIKNSESLLGLHHAIKHSNDIPPLLKPEISTGSSSGFLLNKIYSEGRSYFAFFDKIENARTRAISNSRSTPVSSDCNISLNCFSSPSGQHSFRTERYRFDIGSAQNNQEISVKMRSVRNNRCILSFSFPVQLLQLSPEKFYPILTKGLKKSSLRFGPNSPESNRILFGIFESVSSDSNLSTWLKTIDIGLDGDGSRSAQHTSGVISRRVSHECSL